MKYFLKSEARKPTSASQKKIKESTLKVSPDSQELLSWYQNNSKKSSFRLAFDVDYLIQYVPVGASVLDVGAIPPILSIAIDSFGYHVQGVDIEPERFQSVISQYKLDIKKVNIEVESLPFLENTFDAAVFNEVFEHLRINPIHTLGEIFRVLKPQGILFLSTVNLTSLMGLKSLIRHNRMISANLYVEYSKLKKLGHMGHVRIYTPEEVSDFLREIGFEVEMVIYRGNALYMSYPEKMIVEFIYFLFPKLRPYFSVIAKKT